MPTWAGSIARFVEATTGIAGNSATILRVIAPALSSVAARRFGVKARGAVTIRKRCRTSRSCRSLNLAAWT
jgi:hypothetical protein